MKDSM